MTDKQIDVLDKIQSYLDNGGLFNPELMEHDKVSLMVIEAKAEIKSLRAQLSASQAQPTQDDEIARLRDKLDYIANYMGVDPLNLDEDLLHILDYAKQALQQGDNNG